MSSGCAALLGVEDAECRLEGCGGFDATAFEPSDANATGEPNATDDHSPDAGSEDNSQDGGAEDASDEDAGNPDAGEDLVKKQQVCDEYCQTLMGACDTDDLRQFKNEEGCGFVCMEAMHLAAPDEGANDNTIECRLEAASLASRFSDGLAENCVSAGMLGTHCGGDCPNYCSLMETYCSEEYSELGDCLTLCDGLPRSEVTFHDNIDPGNNLECRFQHIQLASVSESTRLLHCGHAAGKAGPCAAP